MKRNLWLKIISLFVVLGMCFSFVACNQPNNLDDERNERYMNDGDSDKHIHGEVKELLTVEEFVEFALNGARYPENFILEELNGYGRVIESASSREEALKVAAEHFNSGWCTTVENRLEVETDLFYGLYVKWAYRSGGAGEPVSYYDEYVVSYKKDVYDFENKQFFTENADIIKSILNYSCFDHNYISPEYLGFAQKVYSADITKNGDHYEYIAYGLTRVFGDWGEQDELYLLKLVVEIDFATGKTSYRVETVGKVYIDGLLTHVR